MKNNILNLTVLSLFAIFTFSCKGEKENKVETSEAQEKMETEAAVTTYNANAEATKIDWQASKLTGNHTGYLHISKGYINLNDSNEIEGGEFALDMSTITVTDLEKGDGKEDLEAHLKGTVKDKKGDFFNITEYPTGNFVVTGMNVTDGKTWLEGNLTLLETTKNIKFPVNISLDGDTMVLQSEPFTIDRTEWDINFRSKSMFPNIGDKVIYDDISLTVYLEANKS